MIADEYAAALDGDGDLNRATIKLERAYLGACMTSGLLALEDVRPDAFIIPQHAEVWRAILNIVAGGGEPTLTRVIFELARVDRLTKAGGVVYVSSLLDSTDCSEIALYARLVNEASRVRRMRRA